MKNKDRLIKQIIAGSIITAGLVGSATSALMYNHAVKTDPENFKSSDLNKAAAATFFTSGIVAVSGAYYAAKTESEIVDEICDEVLERKKRKKCHCKKHKECEEAKDLASCDEHEDNYNYEDYLNSLGK